MAAAAYSRDSTKLIGSIMVLVGLGFFVVVFVTVFPVMTNPGSAYDRWFPEDTPVVEPVEAAESGPSTPDAVFRWETVSIDSLGTDVYRVRLTSESATEPAPVEWRWEFGDGATGQGRSVVHDYATSGNYTVVLTVLDVAGASDAVAGDVVVPSTASAQGSTGRIDSLSGIGAGVGDDLSGFGDDITSSLEQAVGSVGDDLNSTLDSALGSIGTAVRGAVVVALFGLAALAATIVGWRTARIGVMLLTGGADTTKVSMIERRFRSGEGQRPELEAVG